MQDSPSADELLEAIAAFLEADIMPAQSGRTAFQVRIAVSLCHILAREFRLEPAFLQQEAAILAALLGEPVPVSGTDAVEEVREGAQRLTEAIRNDEPTLDPEAAMEAAMKLVRHKLMVVNPEYLDQPADEAVR